MEENKKVNNETEQATNGGPVETVEKKKFFTKERAKKAGMIITGAVVAAFGTVLCLAIAGAKSEVKEQNQIDDSEPEDFEALEPVSETEDSSESTEEA